MKIITFGVNNFRGITGGIENNTIDFYDSNTIFVFGKNNTGKSSFLNAYMFFYEDKSPIADDFFEKTEDNEIQIEIEVEIDATDKKRLASVSKKSKSLEENYLSKKNRLKIRKIYRKVKNDKGKDEIKVFNQTVNPNSSKGDDPWDDKHYGGIGLHSVFQSCMPVPIYIKAMPTEEEAANIVNKILAIKAKEFLSNKEQKEMKDAVNVINKLQDKMYNPKEIKNYKEKVNEQFQKLFKDTEIDLGEKDAVKFTPTAMGKKFDVRFNRINKDKSVNDKIPNSYESIGHGAIRTAIFTLFLMQDIVEGAKKVRGKKDYLVLFEEPELFLHPLLIKTLRSLIYQVSDQNTPYQILCASHSPQMIDITKTKASLVRMVKKNESTRLYQVGEKFLKEKGRTNRVKKELYEALRFNPFVCESFYADEIILVEGDTEAVLIRAYMQCQDTQKDLFVVNCGTVNNIPFFQEVFSKFNIKYHVLCDSDGKKINGKDQRGNPIFKKYIQGSIYTQIKRDNDREDYTVGLLRVHENNFEEASRNVAEKDLKFPFTDSDIKRDGKPHCANEYWNQVLEPNIGHSNIDQVPIIKFIKEIINN